MSIPKVGIITFHDYDNYGAILQSYALERKIVELGCKAEIIDYQCDYIKKPYRLINLQKKGLCRYLYGVFGHFFYMFRRPKCNEFRKNMTYSAKATASDLSAINDQYDIYVAGSDQIWDYTLTNSDHTYFLDFVLPREGRKKCSYAVSFGEHVPPEKDWPVYRALIESFDHVLVREQSGAELVQKLTGSAPECVCDPTLLLTAEEWQALAEYTPRKRKYILVYQLGVNRDLVAFVRRLAKKSGLAVVYIPFPLVGPLKCSCQLTIGPAQWLGLFQNAEYVVSDSLHGIVFALLFNKTFFAKSNGYHVNRRLEDLLKLVDLSNRTIDRVADDDLLQPIDFTYANEKLAQYRNQSVQSLKNMLES